jgi:hypothetical protein
MQGGDRSDRSDRSDLFDAGWGALGRVGSSVAWGGFTGEWRLC